MTLLLLLALNGIATVLLGVSMLLARREILRLQRLDLDKWDAQIRLNDIVKERIDLLDGIQE